MMFLSRMMKLSLPPRCRSVKNTSTSEKRHIPRNSQSNSTKCFIRLILPVMCSKVVLSGW